MSNEVLEVLKADAAVIKCVIDEFDRLVIDTSELQLQNLCAFLQELGYVITDGETLHIQNEDKGNGNPDFISFNLAVQLFNQLQIKISCGWVYSHCKTVAFTEQEWDNALSTKVIDKVKLQRCHHSYSGIQCHDHYVTFIQ